MHFGDCFPILRFIYGERLERSVSIRNMGMDSNPKAMQSGFPRGVRVS